MRTTFSPIEDQVYERCQLAKVQLEKLIQTMSEFENADPESDRIIQESLYQLIQYLTKTYQLLD